MYIVCVITLVIHFSMTVLGESAEQKTLRDVSHLPDHIEEIVPISMANLLDFVDSMAGCWERIGIKLGLGGKVDELQQVEEKFSNGSNLIILLEAWLENERGVSWGRLIHILESSEVNLGTVAANIKDFLFKQGLYRLICQFHMSRHHNVYTCLYVHGHVLQSSDLH